MYSNKLYTPLRYPGGKAKFAPFIASTMEANGLAGGHYLEPYAGGAAVALELLFHGFAAHVHINDYDPAVYDFWISVTQTPEAVLKLVRDTPVTMEQWYYWRDVLRGNVQVDQPERGFATLFMNRTNRSGILKAGVIGGLEQAGAYKLDARFKKDVLVKRIERIAASAKNITVYNEDALTLLSRCHQLLPKCSLVYLDPPYYMKGQGLYRNFYGHEDHEQIATLLQRQSGKFKRPWVVSYDNVKEIQTMYALSRSLTYGLSYTAQKRYVGSEIMFFSNNLQVLDDEIPSISQSA
ncbi:DNA adenine methylase [Paralcaligenes sp. KSB-10]|uniref:DNA adenine methylase n=1 Tax=Paralcaligenes sp. KSB-10 TaxID=2901142 RepID=UPI001E3979BD|nr:DNA adenine methylase [Paralcaligenes sp. KSB-10]UHL65765.1 DNA adenine methylase [Paralcaligenes sp. KSB-10]